MGESITGGHHQFAGNDDLRRRNFQRQLNDPTIRVILRARGGYGTARIVETAWTSRVSPPHPLNRSGTAVGELVGGNLSLLQTITGTASQASFVGRILFLEDLDEYLYHVDCVLLHLHRSG